MNYSWYLIKLLIIKCFWHTGSLVIYSISHMDFYVLWQVLIYNDTRKNVFFCCAPDSGSIVFINVVVSLFPTILFSLLKILLIPAVHCWYYKQGISHFQKQLPLWCESSEHKQYIAAFGYNSTYHITVCFLGQRQDGDQLHLFPILIIIQYSGRKSKESTSAILHAHLRILLGVSDPSRHFRRCQWHSAAVLWICLFRLKNWEVNSSLSFMIWSFSGSLCFAFFFFLTSFKPFKLQCLLQIPKQNLIFWNLWQNIYNLGFLVSKLAIRLITQWWRVEILYLFNEIAAEEYNFVWFWDNMTRFKFMTILIQIQRFVCFSCEMKISFLKR